MQYPFLLDVISCTGAVSHSSCAAWILTLHAEQKHGVCIKDESFQVPLLFLTVVLCAFIM
jgi:hypothetical protein